MIVILEGPDGSGKSTLTNNLYSYFSKIIETDKDGESRVETRPGRIKKTKDELMIELERMANSKKLYLLDRSPISDIVYRVFDDYQPVFSLKDLMSFINRNISRVFIIRCRVDDSYNIMRKRGDDNPVALYRYDEICKVYQIIFDAISSITSIRTFDFTKSCKNDLFIEIVEWIEEAKRVCYLVENSLL